MTDATSNGMVVTETTQFVTFVEKYSVCQETNCQGKLKVNSIELAGLGGAASLSFCCTKCGSCNVKFETSSLTEKGDAAVSKILQVATICSGTSCAIYKKMFHHILGMHTVSDSVFLGQDVSTCEGHFRWHLLGSQKGNARYGSEAIRELEEGCYLWRCCLAD